MFCKFPFVGQSAALGAANALPIPFDQAISFDNPQGRQVVENLVTTLRATESALEGAFILFDLSIPEAD